MVHSAEKLPVPESAGSPTPVAEEAPPTARPEGWVRSRLAEFGPMLVQGCTRLDRFDAALDRFAAGAPTVTEIGRRADVLRAQGRQQLDRLRTTALKKVDEAPRTIITAVTGVARSALHTVSSDLHAIAKRLDPGRAP